MERIIFIGVSQLSISPNECGERGSGGIRFLIILYALGIIGVALHPLRSHWLPYVQEARVTLADYLEWGDPPRRTAEFDDARKRPAIAGRTSVPVIPQFKHEEAKRGEARGEREGFLSSLFPNSVFSTTPASSGAAVSGGADPKRGPVEKTLAAGSPTDGRSILDRIWASDRTMPPAVRVDPSSSATPHKSVTSPGGLVPIESIRKEDQQELDSLLNTVGK